MTHFGLLGNSSYLLTDKCKALIQINGVMSLAETKSALKKGGKKTII